MTHAETDTTARRPGRNAAKIGKPLRKPTRSPGARWAPSSAMRTPETCLVAALAEEAAAALRLNWALRHERADHDAELIDALEGPDDYVRPSEMKEALFDRLRAIADLASHRRARSLKGALSQLYLAANHSLNPAGLVSTRLSSADTRELEENDRKVSRLHYGAIAHLEQLALDDDLIEVRNWYFTPEYDVQHACDRAILARDDLVAEARALAARDAATHRAE